MSERVESSGKDTMFHRLRKTWFMANVAVGGALYWGGQVSAFPLDAEEPLDLNVHSKHVLPGFLLAVVSRVGSEGRIPYPTAVSLAGVTAVSGLFETGWIDGLWYRNTTHDPIDVAYTVAGAVMSVFAFRAEQQQAQ